MLVIIGILLFVILLAVGGGPILFGLIQMAFGLGIIIVLICVFLAFLILIFA
tara:strand:- start:308 stop:463 length:156 start_codon:yes stop_codon:yes gene_type:complete